jgi:putative oxidoreductase
MDGLEKLKPLALLVLRLALGVIFVYHGYPKLFTQTHDTMGKFVHMGFPGYFAFLAGVIEFFGGAMLIVGLFTRIAGLFLFVEMLIALVQVHHLFSDPRAVENYQFPLTLAAGALVLAAIGGGLVSLDHAIAGNRGGGGGGGGRRGGGGGGGGKKFKGGGRDRE